MDIRYEKLTDINDSEIEILKKLHGLECIKKFISISDNYFDYVITNNNVYYFKIKQNNILIGALHIEKNNMTIFLSIWIKPEMQHLGLATKVITDFINGKFNLDFNKIIVSIEKENFKSINLFKKLGFKEVNRNEELIDFELKK